MKNNAKTIISKFLRFLKDEGAYENYIIAFNKQENYKWRNLFSSIFTNNTQIYPVLISIINKYKNTHIKTKHTFFLSAAFNWKSTSQGVTYWSKITEKWNELQYNDN